MSLPSASSVSTRILQSGTRRTAFKTRNFPRQHVPRAPFHASPRVDVVKPFLLADIGEGITEVQIIQWFVQPGARVAQFDKICEVTSDKATSEISSRFDGVIKKLYYEPDDTAIVGKPLVDIDVEGDIPSNLQSFTTPEPGSETEPECPSQFQTIQPETSQPTTPPSPTAQADSPQIAKQSLGRNGTLATPAVRHLSKELDVDIAEIQGTGKDGRVLKEDLQRFAAARSAKSSSSLAAEAQAAPSVPLGQDKAIPIAGIQQQMFKSMTKSLAIPHFMYSDAVDFTALTALRRRLNASLDSASSDFPKLSALPFIIKAVSMTLASFPSINAHLDTSNPDKPVLTQRAAHNIGVAMDTPQGLVVPVLHGVQSRSISDLATDLARLSALARANKLSKTDITGATFTVSNIGSIGGLAVAPVIVPPQVAILGVGKARTVPAFSETGEVVKREEAVFSWSADHRVVDGAMAARCAERVRWLLERPERMVVGMR